MEQYEFGEALRKLAMGLGLKTLETWYDPVKFTGSICCTTV
jgi:hypothetical protein